MSFLDITIIFLWDREVERFAPFYVQVFQILLYHVPDGHLVQVRGCQAGPMVDAPAVPAVERKIIGVVHQDGGQFSKHQGLEPMVEADGMRRVQTGVPPKR